ncbi:MAG: type II toxin-antitoxin system VapC family toxin [Actinomycetota bacterium]|nr:type II toxin-antitoxin system VapC family toxin [Actinomycetota bacterium]
MTAVVLDASALLAYLHDESGAEVVEDALSAGGLISAANWAEVLSKFADEGEDPNAIARRLESQGLIGQVVEVVALADSDAVAIAELRPITKPAGLSLGDRACLALGVSSGARVVTADRAWADLDLDIDVHTIR